MYHIGMFAFQAYIKQKYINTLFVNIYHSMYINNNMVSMYHTHQDVDMTSNNENDNSDKNTLYG